MILPIPQAAVAAAKKTESRRKDKDNEFGIWHFEAEVRDFGTVQTYMIPVRQVCWSMNEACFRVLDPVPARSGL